MLSFSCAFTTHHKLEKVKVIDEKNMQIERFYLHATFHIPKKKTPKIENKRDKLSACKNLFYGSGYSPSLKYIHDTAKYA